MKVRTATLTAIAFAVGGAAAVLLTVHPFARTGSASHVQPVWSEVQWPFALDQWGKGKAFHCGASDCGVEVHVYLRAKIGFCNCTKGVSDDDELDRIGDLELVGDKTSAQDVGREIKVAWMKGRSRAFSVAASPLAARSALSIGLNDHCDAIIATAVVGEETPNNVEAAVLEFLGSKPVLHWAEMTLGL